MAIRQWKLSFYVNGRRTEQIVSAVTSIDAWKIIESQYAGAQITNRQTTPM